MGRNKDGAWEWDEDIDKNSNAETFVCVDHVDILRHTAYISGLCLRQRIAGPLEQKFLKDSRNEESYASVPEFGAFWSETPLSTWFRRTSAKIFMLVLTLGLIYMVIYDGPLDFFYKWTTKTHKVSTMSLHAAILRVETDPSLNLEPLIFNSVGFMRIDTTSLPLGYINHVELPFGFLPDSMISNYTVIPPPSTTLWDQHVVDFSHTLDYVSAYFIEFEEEEAETPDEFFCVYYRYFRSES